MFIFYDLIYLIYCLVYLPYFIFTGRWRRGFLTRCGFLPPRIWQKIRPGENIWLHAVSVGEVKAGWLIVQQLRRMYPDTQIIISTITRTGNEVAYDLSKGDMPVIYLPLDFSFIARRVIAQVRPRLFLIMETELWPNLILSLHHFHIPIIQLNGRISDKAVNRYLGVRFFLGPVMSKINKFCMRTDVDVQRIVMMGADPHKVALTGNVKYDQPLPDLNLTMPQLRQKLSLQDNEQLFIAGSTHKGEEEIVVSVYQQLKPDFPRIKLLIAPRHIERIKDTQDLLDRQKAGYQLVSRAVTDGDAGIYILDTMGELGNYFALADIIFIGGSLVPHGGHNIIEAAVWAKPILFGPYMANFQEMADLFLMEKAALRVANGDELFRSCRELLGHKKWRDTLGQQARETVAKNQGAVERTLAVIKEIFTEK